MKKHVLLTLLAFLSLQFNGHAQTTTTVEQWNFDSPSNGTGINGTIIDTWAAAATGNSDLGGGVLRYGNTDDSNWGNGALLPDIDMSTIATMTWTIQLADAKVSTGSNFRFTGLVANGGTEPELELTAWGAAPYTFSPDMEYAGNTDATWGNDANVPQTGGTLGGPLTIVATWDFVNNTMTMQVGSNNPMTITATATMATSIGTMTGLRMYPRTIAAGDYLDLDSVTIETTSLPLSTSNTVLDNAKVWYSNSANVLHIEGVTANSVRVYALSGAKVAQYDNPGNTIALGDLSSGLYIASVLSEHGTKAFKFVK